MPGLPLRVTGLRLQLGSVPTVDLAELALEPGTLTVLFGPSGAGKSTLLYLLSGLLVPDEGSVFWGGTDLAALGERQRDRWRGTQAGFVFQNFHLIDELTPLDNVRVTTLFAPRGAAGGKARVLLPALRQFLQYGARYCFPATRGSLTRGMPTGYAAAPLNQMIRAGSDPMPVWPYKVGTVRGIALYPLYPSVPGAAARNPALYELLALFDAVRGGNARERTLAIELLDQRLGS